MKTNTLFRSNAINLEAFDDYLQQIKFFYLIQTLVYFMNFATDDPVEWKFVGYILYLFLFDFLAMSDDHITAYKANIHIHVWNA